MTTNYLLVELTSRMEHEERLRKAQQLRLLPTNVQTGWSTIETAWRNFAQRIHGGQTNVSQPVSNQGSVSTTSNPVVLCTPISEEEWLQIYRMVKKRKLSVEQAAQLLVTMSG